LTQGGVLSGPNWPSSQCGHCGVRFGRLGESRQTSPHGRPGEHHTSAPLRPVAAALCQSRPRRPLTGADRGARHGSGESRRAARLLHTVQRRQRTRARTRKGTSGGGGRRDHPDEYTDAIPLLSRVTTVSSLSLCSSELILTSSRPYVAHASVRAITPPYTAYQCCHLSPVPRRPPPSPVQIVVRAFRVDASSQ
jgi:hypothetical protein